jgi:uncharacterized membrane protein YcfT
MAETASLSTARDPRVPWVDYAKGICIIFVVMMHSTLGVGEDAGGEGFMHYVVAFARPFRMPDFFLISGLFLSLVIDRDWRKYLDRKVVHFFYFYVLWMLIQGVLKWLPDGPAVFGQQFAFALVQPFGTLWFIYLLPVFFVTAKLLKNMPAWIVLIVAAALEIAPIHTGWIVIDEFCERFIYFCVGWYAAPYVFAFAKMIADRAGPALVALALWALVNIAAVFWLGISTVPGVSLALGLLGCFAVVATAALLARFKIADFVRYCGEHSIVIYLACFLPMAATRIALLKTDIITDIGWISVIVTAMGVICPLILYWLTQWTGWGRFLFERPAAFRIDTPQARFQPAE